jgi:hypothetical protein
VEPAVALAITIATTHSCPHIPAPTGTARSSAAALKRFDLAAAGNPAVSHADPAPGTAASGNNMDAKLKATKTSMTTIITRAAVTTSVGLKGLVEELLSVCSIFILLPFNIGFYHT